MLSYPHDVSIVSNCTCHCGVWGHPDIETLGLPCRSSPAPAAFSSSYHPLLVLHVKISVLIHWSFIVSSRVCVSSLGKRAIWLFHFSMNHDMRSHWQNWPAGVQVTVNPQSNSGLENQADHSLESDHNHSTVFYVYSFLSLSQQPQQIIKFYIIIVETSSCIPPCYPLHYCYRPQTNNTPIKTSIKEKSTFIWEYILFLVDHCTRLIPGSGAQVGCQTGPGAAWSPAAAPWSAPRGNSAGSHRSPACTAAPAARPATEEEIR